MCVCHRGISLTRSNSEANVALNFGSLTWSGSFRQYIYLFFETGFFCVALEPVLELALVDQAGLELTEICLPLPPECWD